MTIYQVKRGLGILSILLSILFIVNCSGDDSSDSAAQSSVIVVTGAINPFGEVNVLGSSSSQNLQVTGDNLVSNLSISVTNSFLISLDNVNFLSELTIGASDANAINQTIYVKFSPLVNAIGIINGTLMFESDSAVAKTVSLNGVGLSAAPAISVNNASLNFENTSVMNVSDASTFLVDGANLNTVIDLSVTERFEISFDGTNYGDNLQIPVETANVETVVYVRFAPLTIGDATGILSVINAEVENVEISLSGNGVPVTYNYVAFNQKALAFGNGFNQSASQVFNLHSDLSNISQIKMYLQIDCPGTGCDDWDRFANVKVKDQSTGDWYEIGRYITPYWVGTGLLERGLEFDVTDFKSLLVGTTELRIYIENWTAKADLITVDFDYIEGTPDYPYYAVSEILGYHANSIDGVPYGVGHSFDLDKQISVPSNAESTHLRTVISGWGHATPNDQDGRPCAEWCFRTHNVVINGVAAFQHNLEPLGCASNPINNQNPGNWQPDRAGWCPGMVVPPRVDSFGTPLAGTTFDFEYDYENWVSDGVGGNAFYATSTYVVVKSNTPIAKPVVAD
ncbi:peptide-N-glycosidase F-related protein [Winogradskyella sp.]|uniref:peptide-N-glycosidase F-related protein n=1 Tax=Winogradskyella sp. TaxID=1883156 RepID=UPI0025E45F3C|nr:peptide-N-glycosidase F-related protein [Winogradskyella sp.]